MLLYHHCANIKAVKYDEIKPEPKYSDKYAKDAYSWLEKKVGFYPFFLAVGKTEEDLRMTGYQNQWRKLISQKPEGNEYVKKGEFRNDILFSFENLEGIFTDYDYWHLVLCASHKNYQMTNYEERLIFKPSWSKSKWLREAIKNPHSIQLITNCLDLRKSKRVWCRNKETKKYLEGLGFRNVEVKIMKVDNY